eukprot:PITA_16806
MDKYFECEEVSDDRRVKFTTTRLKGDIALWWDSVQGERRRMNKLPIRKWPRMVVKMKGRFLPKDYQIALHRQVQNLKQRGMMVKEYTKEFYQVNLRVGYTEDTPEKTARRGQGSGRGKGQPFGRGRAANNSEEGSSSKTSGVAEKEGSTRGGRPYQRGRGNGRGRGAAYQCYKCHKWVHRSFECPEGEQASPRGAYVAQPKEVGAPPQEVENVLETGEALILNKVLLKPAKEIADQTQRKALFQTVCESHRKCCKMIIDSGSTDNLVATEMVEKLGLKWLKHPTPYKGSWL